MERSLPVHDWRQVTDLPSALRSTDIPQEQARKEMFSCNPHLLLKLFKLG